MKSSIDFFNGVQASLPEKSDPEQLIMDQIAILNKLRDAEIRLAEVQQEWIQFVSEKVIVYGKNS